MKTNVTLAYCLVALTILAAFCAPGKADIPTPTATAAQAFGAAFSAWASGHQGDAEAMLETDVQQFPTDQHLAFFQAACTRSRFDTDAARPLLFAAAHLQPNSAEAKCAVYVARIDANSGTIANFHSLAVLSKAHPEDNVILWMLAVECRQLERAYFNTPTGDTACNYGISCYAALLTRLNNVGPSLVHQTYANLLEDKGNLQAAVVHRRLAVQQEPADWDCDMLVYDLDKLGLSAEAAQDRVKYAAYLTPHN